MENQHFIQDLKQSISGEVFTDRSSLGMYATDASVYQIFPKAIVVPKTESDVIQAHKIASKYGISILPRGAGTSLAGQTVGNSLVIDFSKYLNNILELDVKNKSVKVQPGVIHGELNNYLKPHGLIYGPDPATSSRANMGGIVANNSSGSRSIVFGKAIDHIIDMRVVLANGEIIEFSDLDAAQLKKKKELDSPEGAIYRQLDQIISEDKELIDEKFPKVLRRVSGYSLDEFINGHPWNLGKLICGSEGTLGTILDVTVNLLDLPVTRGLTTIHYHDRMEAIADVKNILPFGPSAVELMDFNVIEIAQSNPSSKQIAGFIEGNPGAILIVEFFGDNREQVVEKYEALTRYLETSDISYAHPFFDPGPGYNNIWEVRKKGLGLLLSMRTPEKPLPFIEDACVPVETLEDYIGELVTFCDKLDTKLVLYAHASVGVLHVRPVLNLRKKSDLEKFETIAQFTLKLVMKYKGSWSGEHGDGIVRSFGIPIFYGEKIYQDFKKIKQAFDPHNLMNPGKIVDAPYLTEHLRYGNGYQDQKVETIYHYRKELGFDSLIHMCNGVGVCQRVSGGVMCPSYKASLDEKDSTRGRANLLRLTLSGQVNQGDFTSQELLNVLDLCVSCKSCKTECPSNVDIAKLKSEVLQMSYDKKGYGLKGLFIILSDDFSKWFSGKMSYLINPIIKTKLFRHSLQLLAGIDARRILDPYANESLKKWFKNKFKATADGQKVILFADTYINYHQVEIGRAIVSLLDSMNFRVELIDTGGSKRPLISNGFLRKAKQKGEKIARQLEPALKNDVPVIVCEPSAYSALAEDIPDLIDNVEMVERMQKQVVSLEKFVADFLEGNKGAGQLVSKESHHVIHGHCHQKAMEGTKYLSSIFEKVNGGFDVLDAGCCGMAGAFGFEKEHYDFSKKIFEQDLAKKLSKYSKDQLILATGFSCRHQIDDLADYKVKHWVEILKYSKIDAH